ncbi:uncharacterized protein LOC116259815 isoform X2 [Nymphaea colorata]|nr:uncharacterized protein LOC116259815 isoform X2 [Nymphaea colorata]XP_031493606.1 uncharacterized protein LOC116259815 isoform X2 [Nymphaea colorata]XP_031493607.1 uncharacterized protein LOC116259815 isoform X2 [Nymphaea colorata]XP_031493608.1 uncharacterized protein LOC116259815 isoform X2 [Nymphaea colorata]
MRNCTRGHAGDHTKQSFRFLVVRFSLFTPRFALCTVYDCSERIIIMGSLLNMPPISQQWHPALLQILQTKQSQLEFLAKERTLLEDHINLQHHLWCQDLASFQDAIVESERTRKKLNLSLLLEAAKSDLIIGMKEKDALLYKLKLEYIESDLEDMEMFIQLQSKYSNKKNIQSENKRVECAVKEDGQHELRRLKHEYEKLACQKETEVSALLSERDFVWNQLKRMEDEYIILLKRKGEQLESAHVNTGNLEHENKKQDTIIANLKSEIIERNNEVERLSLKLSELSRNLEIQSIEKENLQLLCFELEHQVNKQKNHSRNACAPNEVTSRNLIYELTTASNNAEDGEVSTKTCYQQKGFLNKVKPLNDPSLGGSRSPLFEGEEIKVPKGSRSLSKKRRKRESTMGRQSLFSSAFKVPRLRASHSVV